MSGFSEGSSKKNLQLFSPRFQHFLPFQHSPKKINCEMKNLIPQIRFSYNWNNKLACKAFTTIRLHNHKKYQPGRVYHIWLKTPTGIVDYGYAECKKVVTRRKSKLGDWVCLLDTGYPHRETERILTKMYKNKVSEEDPLFDVILLVKLPKSNAGVAQAAQKEVAA